MFNCVQVTLKAVYEATTKKIGGIQLMMYIIDTTNLKNKWYNDPNFDLEDKRTITFENIPHNSIKLIYKGSDSDLLKESINI